MFLSFSPKGSQLASSQSSWSSTSFMENSMYQENRGQARGGSSTITTYCRLSGFPKLAQGKAKGNGVYRSYFLDLPLS